MFNFALKYPPYNNFWNVGGVTLKSTVFYLLIILCKSNAALSCRELIYPFYASMHWTIEPPVRASRRSGVVQREGRTCIHVSGHILYAVFYNYLVFLILGCFFAFSFIYIYILVFFLKSPNTFYNHILFVMFQCSCLNTV